MLLLNLSNVGDYYKGYCLFQGEILGLNINNIPYNSPTLYQVLQDKYSVEDVNVGGDLAVAHIIWSTVVTPKAGGELINANGNWIMNLKKQPDGAWNCIYTIFSDESLVKPSTTE